jgi:putative DeoR family transcriptional regulator (stage III sporulation protein D)
VKNQARIETRIIDVSKYLLDTKSTIREIALIFNVSKSTIHKDLRERLPKLNSNMYAEVDKILDYNKSMRSFRGGEATRIKYANKQSENGGGIVNEFRHMVNCKN